MKSRITVVLVQYFLNAQMIWSHDISFLVRGLTPSIFMGTLPAYLHETPRRAKHCSVNIYKQHLSASILDETLDCELQGAVVKILHKIFSDSVLGFAVVPLLIIWRPWVPFTVQCYLQDMHLRMQISFTSRSSVAPAMNTRWQIT
jgi:hypothetical protein